MKKNIYKSSLFFPALILFSIQSGSQELSFNNDAGRASGGATLLPRVSVTEYYTDNYYRTSANKTSGWTTDISPGIHFNSSVGRFTGSVDYSLHQIIQSNDAGQNELQNALDLDGVVEALDKRVFVDLNGKISQRTISAFGAQSGVDSAINSNKTEVSSFRISPYAKGYLNRFADYEARYALSTTRAKSAQFANSTDESASFKLKGTAFTDRLHWTSLLSTERIEQGSSNTVKSDNFNNSLGYVVDPQFNVTATFGREYGNYVSSEGSYKTTTGLTVVWLPTERTTVSAEVENSLAGKTHKFNFEHRTSKTSWRVSDVKSVSFSNALSASSIQGNAYDLLFSQLATVEPDPVKRAALVNNLLLTNYGVLYESILSGYLTGGTSIQRTQDVSFSLLGVRDIVTVTAMQNSGQKLLGSSTVADDFSNASLINQRALTVSLTHRLNSEMTLSAQLTGQKNTSDNTNLVSNLKSISVDASAKLNLKTMVTLGVRRTIYSNVLTPYGVNSISGGLTMQF
jgi:uncharacterized protein (PEP-CTERM system associated)